MGFFDAGLKAGVGWPNPGWAPPSGTIGGTISGQVISTDAAFTADGFIAGIRLIAEDISSLPLKVYERLGPGKGKREAPEHHLYPLLHDAPNPEMTSMVWRETGIGHLYSWGNWYAEKELNGSGRVVGLWPLRPDRMNVLYDTATGLRVYEYTLPDNKRIRLPARNVFHVPGFGFDGLIGYNRINLMRRQIESALALEEFGLRTFTSGAQPGVTIKHPQKLSDLAKKNISEGWDAGHKGLTNAQRTAILDEGMSLELSGFPPEDAQYLDSQRLSLEKMARGLRLSPHKLSDMFRATFNNIEESNIDHWSGSLRTPIVRIEQQINKDLVGDRKFYAEHSMDAVMRGKYLERMQGNQIAILSGQRSPDEVREKDNMNPIPNDAGSTFVLPLNMSPMDLLAAAVMARQQPPPVGGTPQ